MAPAKKKTAVQGPVVDLDAAEQKYRAEREASGPHGAPVINFRGESYQLVDELPLEVILAVSDIDDNASESSAARAMVRSVRSLFAEGEWDRFLGVKPTTANLMQLFEIAFAAYADLDLGESEASEAPSSNTGTQSRQPSKPDTASSS